MTEADQAETYEQRVHAIELANQPILEGFERWLKQAGLSEQTIRDQVDTCAFSRAICSCMRIPCAVSTKPPRGRSMLF